MRKYMSVDIGGTAIKYGIVSEDGKVLYDAKMQTQKGAIVKEVCEIIEGLTKGTPEAAGIGISTAGIVDTSKGKVIYANDNIPGYSGTEWKKTLEKRFSKKVIVNNDVNSAALAEAWVGAARGVDNFFCLTIGTGIGGAAFVNGKLLVGEHSHAAEIGYMVIDDTSKRYEKNASNAAFVAAVEAATGLSGLEGRKAFDMARNNEELFRNVMSPWFDSLSRGIANIICNFDPALIVIGGGISREGNYLTEHIKESLSKYLPEAMTQNVAFKIAECQNKAGMIGAIYDFTH